ARQIVLDLKGKVVVTEEVSEGLLDIATEHEDLAVQEALLALEALGYSKRELKKVEKAMQQQIFSDVDEAVKYGLKQLIS
ncbi:Holliday junction branch migration protein RuvA, partial [Staphylococcus pseudintermedius]|nr:Holliday junction branch migration protein RuvA [Staphylococcus pseudintermedius]